MVSMKDYFDKVMNNNQEPESDNDDNQGPESADGDNQEPEWNQDYFEDDRCPFCGFPDYNSTKLGMLDDVTFRFFECHICSENWGVKYNKEGEILKYCCDDDFLSLIT